MLDWLGQASVLGRAGQWLGRLGQCLVGNARLVYYRQARLWGKPESNCSVYVYRLVFGQASQASVWVRPGQGSVLGRLVFRQASVSLGQQMFVLKNQFSVCQIFCWYGKRDKQVNVNTILLRQFYVTRYTCNETSDIRQTILFMNRITRRTF